MTQTLTITRPDDWHLHLRDGAMLNVAANATAKHFSRAIIMPNLTPPVTQVSDAKAYYQRIKQTLPEQCQFEPLMTLYLTDATSPEMIAEAAASGIVKACKLYPANATTNSAHGVTNVSALRPVFQAMAEQGLLLLVHGEVTHSDIDIFDREAAFIDAHMRDLVASLPDLKIVFEHITTAEAAEFVMSAPDNVAATITPQHLMYNRNHLLAGGLRPHNYCLPVLKRQTHQQALQKAVATGTKKIFLGTDSAPHVQGAKESACGCAGCYSAPAAIELYAEIFDQLGILDKLEGFASFNGPDFYGLPRNSETITLSKQAWQVPESVMVEDETLVPFFAGETLQWQVK
ncbi:dihydroorotase [Agarivorans sp. Toyoura001]|uniref:dihydroorotase n=1 Tax=Agarivorans sp. Toyoura001 TaxID=2283141 RepID=UPI0010EC6865|nr:dihydroorotase [Agarivorans sp. Toyoura001]GDY25780.1 dihydroorotase [Agarivorans sp. Toyoura001]